MNKQVGTTTPIKESRSFNWRGVLFWPFLILLLYALSSGPVLMLMEKRHLAGNQFLNSFYMPLDWAYQKTFFHKPLGMYLHLWTDVYDKNGEIVIDKMK